MAREIAEAYAYPPEVARAIQRAWPELHVAGGPAVLERAISACYQASLLHEEGRPVTFRVGFGEPGGLSAASGQPTDKRGLVFTRPRPFDEHELRRLAPAAAFARSLIGATLDGEAGPEIWGLIHAGHEELVLDDDAPQSPTSTMPPLLIVAVTGPGRLRVSAGQTTLVVLSHGMLAGRGLDLFEAPWMQELFSDMGGVQWMAHLRDRQEAPERWASLNAHFGPALACHVLRRILSAVRGSRHGGTLIVIPHGQAGIVVGDGGYIRLKYEFQDNEPRRRILPLTIEIMNETARRQEPSAGQSTVGWSEYAAGDLEHVPEMDRALAAVGHLVADLTHVDGAVVMTNRLELLGFGGEIVGALPDVTTVARARDLAGTQREPVRTDRVGTRHRSVYRLCHTVRDALAVVASQDGGLRFVRWHGDAVTYWDQMATVPLEV